MGCYVDPWERPFSPSKHEIPHFVPNENLPNVFKRRMFLLVIPAQAGIQCPEKLDSGFPHNARDLRQARMTSQQHVLC